MDKYKKVACPPCKPPAKGDFTAIKALQAKPLPLNPYNLMAKPQPAGKK